MLRLLEIVAIGFVGLFAFIIVAGSISLFSMLFPVLTGAISHYSGWSEWVVGAGLLILGGLALGGSGLTWARHYRETEAPSSWSDWFQAVRWWEYPQVSSTPDPYGLDSPADSGLSSAVDSDLGSDGGGSTDGDGGGGGGSDS